MVKYNIYSRRSFLSKMGSNFLLPFFVNVKETELNTDEDAYKTMLKPDGSVVKVKASVLKKAKVVSKTISNKSLLNWTGKER